MISQALSDYYDLSLICEDDIKIVALLVQIVSLEINSKVLNDLENAKCDKYSREFEKLLTMPPKAIKSLNELLSENVIRFENKKLVKVVDKDTTLLTLMEKD